jgi:hypothetical protein
VCDPNQAGEGAQKCGTSNVVNGTPCPVPDKCVVQPACTGGSCVGTPKACTASGSCRVAECNPSTGECEETVAPVGTACQTVGSCTQAPACDAAGNCVGTALPDGSPCEREGCATVAVCANQACVCATGADLSAAPVDAGAVVAETDASMPADPPTAGGCSMNGVPSRQSVPMWLALFLLLLPRARSRRRGSHARA